MRVVSCVVCRAVCEARVRGVDHEDALASPLFEVAVVGRLEALDVRAQFLSTQTYDDVRSPRGEELARRVRYVRYVCACAVCVCVR